MPFGTAFETFGDASERACECDVDDIAGGARTAISSIDELDGAGCGNQSEGGEIEHAFRIDDLAVLERQPIALESPEQLLDAPAQAIELHDFVGLRGGADLMRRVQAPMQRRLAGGRIDFARLHQCEFDAVGNVVQTVVLRARDAHGCGVQFDYGDALFFPWPTRRHPHLGRSQRFGFGERLEHFAAIGQIAILCDTHDQIEPIRSAREQRINVAFPIGDHGHRTCFTQQCGRRLTAGMPTCQFLLLKGTISALRFVRSRSGPDRRVDEPDHRLRFDVHRNHRVNEEARRLAVPGRPKAAPLLRPAGEVDLGRVLHRQHPAPDALLGRASSRRFHDLGHRNVGRRQKAVHRHLACSRLANPSQHQRSLRRDPIDRPVRTFCDPNISKRHRQVSQPNIPTP